ncbi:glycosyltransferase family 1 protein [Altericroceibacterium spongiae]|uniref:Glycosyltransferase family 1 protein n=1 Tax=Altericroceibacterium spongiae TaxID=2320269 RepID=A0A420EEL1_9SPHN|nr:glycosyltransferase family 1 protein [Altericroceibacterium spongiae]RKF19086.1 glycosyltransferase family 1 protein [Altericroceibacterium spongiae]
MKIALITDAWVPQVNGVVRTLQTVTEALMCRGHKVMTVSPDQFRSVPCPTYPEIRLSFAGQRRIARQLDAFSPDAIHIATEGPLGLAARRYCVKNGKPFTTAYHTQFPDYLARRTKLPASVFWPYIRWFHRPSAGIMVATETVRRQLREQGLTQLRHWSRGVDLATFRPDVAPPDLFFELPRPIQIYVGRVAVEKNVEAFLSNSHPGSKVVVGDGPALTRLRHEFPEAYFLGKQSGAALAACYAGADVFVFPSRTDTFGLVMIEALACGTPVAAYPVTGPLDVLDARSGAMDERLEQAIARALQCDREDCLAHGQRFSWDASTDQFLAALEPEISEPTLSAMTWAALAE